MTQMEIAVFPKNFTADEETVGQMFSRLKEKFPFGNWEMTNVPPFMPPEIPRLTFSGNIAGGVLNIQIAFQRFLISYVPNSIEPNSSNLKIFNDLKGYAKQMCDAVDQAHGGVIFSRFGFIHSYAFPNVGVNRKFPRSLFTFRHFGAEQDINSFVAKITHTGKRGGRLWNLLLTYQKVLYIPDAQEMLALTLDENTNQQEDLHFKTGALFRMIEGEDFDVDMNSIREKFVSGYVETEE